MADSALNQLGVDINNTYLSASALPHAQGTHVPTRNGRVILVKAGSTIPTYALVAFAPPSATASASVEAFPASSNNVSGALFAVSQVSITKGQYGWVHIDCYKEGRVNAGIAETGVPLYLTATGGTVDDALVSGKGLTGLRLLASVGSASAPPAIWSNIGLDREQLA